MLSRNIISAILNGFTVYQKFNFYTPVHTSSFLQEDWTDVVGVDPRFAPNQWETAVTTSLIGSAAVCHWLGAYLELALNYICIEPRSWLGKQMGVKWRSIITLSSQHLLDQAILSDSHPPLFVFKWVCKINVESIQLPDHCGTALIPFEWYGSCAPSLFVMKRRLYLLPHNSLWTTYDTQSIPWLDDLETQGSWTIIVIPLIQFLFALA